MADVAEHGARKLAASTPLRTAARAGYAVNGIVYALIGITTISVAVGPGGSADQSGALSELSGLPGGVFLLWAIAIALLALALWQVVRAVLAVGADAKKRWAHRLGYLGKAAAYAVVGVTSLTFARGSSSSSSKSSQTFSARLLELPGGLLLLLLVGLAAFAIGVGFIVRGVSKRFLERINLPGGSVGKFVTWLGVVGYSAQGVALCVVGILFWVATATLDPSKASGLDGALKALAGVPFGVFILVIIGIGFIAYGLYSVFRARFARL